MSPAVRPRLRSYSSLPDPTVLTTQIPGRRGGKDTRLKPSDSQPELHQYLVWISSSLEKALKLMVRCRMLFLKGPISTITSL